MPSSHRRHPVLPRRAIVALAVATALVGGATSAVTLPAPKAEAAAAVDYTSFVDPFVSTAGDDGNDMPGAEAPNGLAKVNPMTTPGRNHTGYDYNATQISGFTSTNLDGVGGSGGGGDLLVVPTEVSYSARPSTASYAHTFSHDDETATPGYYQVGLGEIAGTDGAVTKPGGTIDAEVAATTRTSVQRYTFPAGKAPSLVLDLNNNFTQRTASDLAVSATSDGRTALSGSFAGNFNGASYKMYYYAETGAATTGVQTWADGSALDATTKRSGTDTGAVLKFGAAGSGTTTEELRITISPISVAQAKIDQGVETTGKSFDTLRAETKSAWNTRLGSVDVASSTTSDPDGSLKKLFYTHLYRMFGVPVNATSTSGTYRGVDGAIHQADDFTYYDGWSSWDDFRKYSVIAYIDPSLYRDMIQSLIDLFADQHAAGATNLASLVQGVPSVRWERSTVVIADALSKGYTDFDNLDAAYPALRDLVGYYTGQELRQKFVVDNPGTSLMRGYDQWALAQIADRIGKTADAKELRTQAAIPFAGAFKADAWTAGDGTKVGLLTSRNADGSYDSIDYERFEAENLYQGTPWQYNWYGAYDMEATIAAMGGGTAAKLAVEHMFGEDGPDDGTGMLHSNANEVDLQAPYLFNYVGEPSKTQKWVRDIYTKETWNRYIATGSTNEAPSANGEFTPPVKTKVYKLDPAGFLPTMDNDAGTMSTMFVAAAIGLFPVTAGSSQYQIGSPFFDKTTIDYGNGKSFSVTANGVSSDDYYIQSGSLDGAATQNTWVDYSSIVNGGSLDFAMGGTASSWGAKSTGSYSMSTASESDGGTGSGDGSGTGGSGGATTTYPVTASAATITATQSGAVSGSTTLTLGGGATFVGTAGTSLTSSGRATVVGLPDTVTATVTVKSSKAVTVAVKGTIAKNARYYVSFANSALAGGATAATLTGTGVSNLDSLKLSVSSADRVALQKLVDQAVLVQPGNYSYASYAALTDARDTAQAALDNAAATSSTLRAASATLQAAIDGLALDQGAYRVLQAEASDEWSGGELKNEAYQSAGDLGGVTTGSWISYKNLDFAGTAPVRLDIHYASSAATTASPSTVTVHAGDLSGPVVGTASLPGTGSWGSYQTVTADITDSAALMSAKAVTFEFTAPDGQQWVSNFDWFQFASAAAATDGPLTIESEAYKTWSAGALKTETSTWDSGTVVDVGGTYDGAWIDYGDVDFGKSEMESVSIHYVNNSSRVGANSRVDLYLDSYDPAAPGTAYATVALPVTGSDWTHSGTATAALAPTVTGTHRLYAVLHTTADANHPYVGNFDSMTFTPKAVGDVVVEAESSVANSGGGLKSETSNWSEGTVTDLGGTYDGAWLDYGDIDFGSKAVTDVDVHYVNNSSRVGANSRVDFYLDTFDSASPGTPFASVPLPVTGSDWSHDGHAALTLSSALTGTRHLYAVLHTTADANHPYVGNFDDFTFSQGVDRTGLRAAITAAAAFEGKASTYDSIDYGVFTRELAAARALVDADSTTQTAVDAQARSLGLATSQLVPVARLELQHAVDVASDVEDRSYTDATWTAFQKALSTASTVLADDVATDSALRAAATALDAAREALVVKAHTKASAPRSVTATATGTSIGVTWTAPASDGGTAITAYRIALDDGHVITIDDADQRSVVFSLLPKGKRYTATVKAVNAVGTSSAGTAKAVGVSAVAAAAKSTAATGASGTTVKSLALSSSYPSDSWPTTPTGDDYNVYLLRGFSELGPDIKAANADLADGETPTALNDTIMLGINHAATSAEVDRAQRDADNSPETTMADGLGSQLGPLFTAAVAAGDLPKTQAVLDRVSSGLGGADAAKGAYQYLRPYVRMGLASAGGLVYDNKTGGYEGLAGSGSYPSGHTFGGYTFGTTMATLLPELAATLLARASEYGNNRIILGFHYPLDVIGGRMDSQATVAHRWADPAFAAEMEDAAAELESVLLTACEANGYGSTIAECSGSAYDGLSEAGAVSLYTQRLDYGFPQVAAGGQTLQVPAEATALLTTSFPSLTNGQRAQILQQTALDSGYPLDLTSDGDASWERINLAAAMTATYTLDSNGDVTVTNYANATTDAVSTAAAITVGGTAIDGFDPATSTYVVDWPASKALPTVGATATEGGATVKVGSAGATARVAAAVAPAAAAAPGLSGSRTITVTSADGTASSVYTVAFWRTTSAAAGGAAGGAGAGAGGSGSAGGAGSGSAAGAAGGSSGTIAGAADGSTSAAGDPGQLAFTGTSLLGILLGSLLAAFLLAAGTALVVRRRERSGAAE